MKKIVLLTSLFLFSTFSFSGWLSDDNKTKNIHSDNKVYRLKLAETWPTNFPIFGETTKKMAKLVKEMSNGRLLIRVDSKNKHKAPLGIFDMVKAGQYYLGH
jgi:TRAP-type mannitol/chloroaromatic compound transport system substrate-binding protein